MRVTGFPRIFVINACKSLRGGNLFARRGHGAVPVILMSDIQPQAPKIIRARSLPYGKPFWLAVFFFVLFLLCLSATVAAIAITLIDTDPLAPSIMIVGLALCGLTWIIAYVKRRSAHCPLCKGTPLINSGALPHVRAWRMALFNHGVSAILSILATQRFRCMYCGSDFDLLKTKSKKSGGR
jgi:hypothetical protein